MMAATAALSNSGTALAEGAARTGDKVLAQGGATVLSDVARSALAALHAVCVGSAGGFRSGPCGAAAREGATDRR